MKPAQQILHVARKDVRFAGRLLLMHAALVTAAACAWLLGDWKYAFAQSFPWDFVLPLFAMTIAVLLVQEDSATRADAFWISRPLHPAAVFIAKLLTVAAGLVLVATVGQAVALTRFDLGWREYPALLGHSALHYGWWLAMVMVVAAVTRDLRGAVLVFTGLMLAAILIPYAFLFVDPGGAAADAGMQPYIVPLSLAAALGLIGHQYLTRRRRRTTWLAAALGAGLIAVRWASPVQGAADAAESSDRGMLRLQSIEVVHNRYYPHHYRLRLGVAGDPSYAYHMHFIAVNVHHSDGSIDSLDVGQSSVVLSAGAVPSLHAHRMLQATGAGGHEGTLVVQLSAAQGEALTAGSAHLEVSGVVTVTEGRALPPLPILPGAAIADDGYRVTFVSAEDRQDGPELNIEVVTVGRATADRRSHPGAMWDLHSRYFLVWPDRAEAHRLIQRSGSGMGGSLVIPGAGLSMESLALTPTPVDTAAPTQSVAEWSDGAELVVVRWMHRGSHRVRLTARLVP